MDAPTTAQKIPMLTKDQIAEFEKLANPLMEWLNENCNPHTIIIIGVDSAQVYSGEAGVFTEKFIKD